jgi:hypothetical protein
MLDYDGIKASITKSFREQKPTGLLNGLPTVDESIDGKVKQKPTHFLKPVLLIA